MKLSISAYPDCREGDYVCHLTLSSDGNLDVDVAGFGEPEFYAQRITAFARLLADFRDHASEIPSFGVSSGSVGEGTSIELCVTPGEESGKANLTIAKETMHGHLYSGPLKFVHVEENLTLHLEISVSDVNRMGDGLMAASREEFFCFTFDFD